MKKLLSPERKLRFLDKYMEAFIEDRVKAALYANNPMFKRIKPFERWLESSLDKAENNGIKQHEEKLGSRCRYCKRPFDANILKTKDHIIPLSKGGFNHKENRVFSCINCNNWKADKSLDVWAKEVRGFIGSKKEKWNYKDMHLGRILGAIKELSYHVATYRDKMGVYKNIE